jgi:lysophospholipase L1-like esterase
MPSRWRPGYRSLAFLVLLAALAGYPGSSVRADPISIVTLGDSLTATYAGQPTRAGDQSWTDLLQSQRAGQINVYNVAVSGATSNDLAAQVTSASQYAGKASYATVYIGANDLYNYFNPPAGQGTLITPAALVANIAQNLATAVGSLQAMGFKVVVANVPDFGVTPYAQNLLQGDPAALQVITGLTTAVNTQIQALAQTLGVPVVDLFALNNRSQTPLFIGGVQVNSSLYAADGYHPSSIGQALIANTTLEALNLAYGADTTGLMFTDAQILALKGMTAQANTTFDVSPFVQYAPEPASAVLLALGMLGVLARRLQKGISARSPGLPGRV